jgi:hypothetical protein
VSGVWFFRVGLFFWIIVNSGPVGFDPKTFTGPVFVVIGFAQYLLPLAILEGYFRAQRGGSHGAQLVMSATLITVALAMCVGIFGVTAFMWLPNM